MDVSVCGYVPVSAGTQGAQGSPPPQELEV